MKSPLQCGLNQGGSNEADTQESLWKTYRGRLRKLIFANLPLLLLIIGCLPLFLVLVPTASSLNSYSAPTTHFGDAAEFEEPASSVAVNAASKTTRTSPAAAAAAAANDQVEASAEAAAEVRVQHAPQFPKRHRPTDTSRKPASRRADVVSLQEKRLQTTRQHTTREEKEKEKEMLTTTEPKLRQDNRSSPW
ncbi:hypothetical protein MTO96_002984 [Rhipicephalus appendiculatus]